jgi:hypothetical protein
MGQVRNSFVDNGGKKQSTSKRQDPLHVIWEMDI